MTVLADFRIAIRTLARGPLFALTAIASLAIGIGATATIFSFADALFPRPRPGIVDESRLVDVGRGSRRQSPGRTIRARRRDGRASAAGRLLISQSHSRISRRV